ncbi:MAG: hypothetical protein J5854_06915 [Clostridia bacterium]|nr:hypothetical protein [Clostridia bacterium]
MRELDLSAAETVLFAIISAYTSFKGQFDGEMKWLSSWIGTDGAMAEELLAGLAEKGLVETCRNSYGHTVYKASRLGGTLDAGGHKYNNIDNTIDKTIDTSIDPSIDKTTDKKMYRSSINSINKSERLTEEEQKERMLALMSEYGDITKVPIDRLEWACRG